MSEKGDGAKIYSKGYPNKREYFEENHRYMEDNTYNQLPKSILTWNADCKICTEVVFPIKKKGVIINKDSHE